MLRSALMTLLVMWLCPGHTRAAEPSVSPQVGLPAPDFTLRRLDGAPIQLATLREQGPVVVLVLRGYPGYQCPICNRQVGQFLTKADQFAAAQANVVMIYPGPAAGLQEHAAEFVTGKTLPDRFHLLLDPDYNFTIAYGLRWDAPNETAYPSTFVVDQSGVIKFAKISRTHGDRSSVAEVLAVLQ